MTPLSYRADLLESRISHFHPRDHEKIWEIASLARKIDQAHWETLERNEALRKVVLSNQEGGVR